MARRADKAHEGGGGEVEKGGGGGFLQDTWGFCELREEPPGSWKKFKKEKA